MLPKLKTRFHTEDFYQKMLAKEQQQPLAQRKKYSYFGQRNKSSQYIKAITQQKQQSRNYKTIDKNPETRQQSLNQSKDDVSLKNISVIRHSLPIKSYMLLKQKKQQKKLDHIMKLLNEQQNKNQQFSIFSKKKKRYLTQRYDHVHSEFLKLNPKKKKWNLQNLSNFIQALQAINTFFNKLSDIVKIGLLKMGEIKVYQEEEIIYRQNQPLNKIGLILWGEVLLKKRNNKIKIYAFSGDSLCQEIIFPNKDKKFYDSISLRKGVMPIQQSAKSKTKCGILFMTLIEYQIIFRQLSEIGERSNIILAQNMMKWSYSKKKGLRKQNSYIM